MVSRKKAKGRARKAKAKEREAAAATRTQEETSVSRGVIDDVVGTDITEILRTIEYPMQLLQIEESAVNTEGCNHGFVCVSEDDDCYYKSFVRAFIDGFFSVDDPRFQAAVEATEHHDVWDDSSKLERARLLFLTHGTNLVLGGDLRLARVIASMGYYIENHIKIHFANTRAVIDRRKIWELYDPNIDEHTLVSFFNKRIPCSCLRDKHREVKSITKTGICHNQKCSLPRRVVERKSMMSCCRCLQVSYCSKQCQSDDWPEHKLECAELASYLKDGNPKIRLPN
eukprot:scaffold12816_cov126-Skeletonema_dohrnii-CCMP3373.AAC.9